MLGSVELRDYMLKNPLTAKADLTVYEAAQRILTNKVSGLVVIDDRRAMLGMLSELDCLRALLASAYNDEAFSTAVIGDLMSTDVEMQSPRMILSTWQRLCWITSTEEGLLLSMDC